MNAPFQSLAPELLCKIFRLVAPPTVAKVALSAVCSHWRACALADASWWADMRWTSMPQRLFELALERFRSAPLSVFLLPQETNLLQHLDPHAKRIRRLAFFFNPISPPAFLQHGLELPALEFLSVKNRRKGVSGPSLRFRAPRLETLDLYGVVVHQWNDMDIPRLRHFKYDPRWTMNPLDEGVPVLFILHRLLSTFPQIRTIDMGGRCENILPSESSAYGQLMERLRLSLCCSACGIRILASFPRTVERLRVLRVKVANGRRFDGGTHHDESDVQQRSLVMALASGHAYTTLQLADESDYGHTLSATFTTAHCFRNIHVTLPVRSFLLNWPAEWLSLRLSDTLQSISLPLSLWPEFALLTQGQPLMAPSVRICVLARSWNDLSQTVDVARCGLLDCLELCVPGSRKDGASSFRMQPILHFTGAVACVSERVKLVLERSDDPSADASLEERLLSALHAKRVARSDLQPDWTIEWKESYF
ncbi:hypothetical protein EXIGLDRAFT_781843 [Exidia glandulosa HHB12029]|uniref:Uncharacterized protein n=1 Tax=Exidia glandulosa HHB12029 TaxID=1314781 RepID=A0A165B4E4_EXIGL|nr:hypothetical protein EXIGLDRAFT_781843 [Exidia glandulosa HHB12029]